MGHSTRMLRAAAVAAGAIVIAAGMTSGASDAAQKKAQAQARAGQPGDEAAQKQQAAQAAKNNYDSGVKQYQAGKYPQAVENLSAALRVGGLASPDMARALYIRGLAYKKQSKPGLAISDLTSALWLKNGLNDADRASATAERAEAYKLAGLGDGTAVSESVAVADPNTGAVAVAQPAAAAPVVAEAKPAKKGKKDLAAAVPTPAPVAPPPEVARQAPDSPAAQDAARARQMAAMPVEGGGLASVASATVTGGGPKSASVSVPDPAPAVTAAEAVPAAAAPSAPVASLAVPASAAAPAPVLSAAPMEQPATPPAASEGNSPIGNFFSNLFSGGSNETPTAAPVTTASTTQPEASSWNNTTSVASGASAKTVKAVKQSAPQAAPQAAPQTAVNVPAVAEPAAKSGKFKIHIAAVRTRVEAEAIAQKVQAEGGAALKSRTASVDEAVIGSMGTFFRVRVGGYATADEPRGVCNSLRASGFDCLVVTN